MAIDSRYKMSQERLDTLKEELHYLETTREKEVAELIKEARSFGDLSENSEYDEAKTEQGKLYSRIAEITDLIENAEVVEKVEVAADVVTIGSHVRVLDVGVHHRRLAGGQPHGGLHFGRQPVRLRTQGPQGRRDRHGNSPGRRAAV